MFLHGLTHITVLLSRINNFKLEMLSFTLNTRFYKHVRTMIALQNSQKSNIKSVFFTFPIFVNFINQLTIK